MIIRAIKINEDGFCEKCPYQFEKASESSCIPPSRSTCISCRMKEKDSRLILSEIGVVSYFDGKYLVCCDNAGYIDYELPEHLRVMIIEK